MKNKMLHCCFVLIGLALFFQQGYAQNADDNDNLKSVAKKVVEYNLDVQPGEVVEIAGTPAELDLMHELVVAVAKAGGQAHIRLDIPEANKEALMAMSLDDLRRERSYGINNMKNVDCFINVNSLDDPDLFADVPEERWAAIRKANTAQQDAYRTADFRSVDIGQVGGIPSKDYAKSKNADLDEMRDVFWSALSVDYDKMCEKGNKIVKLMKAKAAVRLTSNDGTDLTFNISNKSPRLNCGKTADLKDVPGPASVWLPAGEVYTALDPKSAKGTLVVPKVDFRGKTVTNLKMTFQSGKMTSCTADKNGSLIEKSIKMSDDATKIFSLLDIGINDKSRRIAGSDHVSWEMAGMVTVGIGDNAWAGGDVKADNSFFFHLPKATVRIGKTTLVTNGQLPTAVAMSKAK